MLITRIVLEVLLVLLLLSTGGGKLGQIPSSLAIRDSLKLSNGAWRTIGVLEMLAVLGLIIGIWVPIIGLLASAGIVLLMIGAIVARARVAQRTPGPYILDAVVGLIATALLLLHTIAL